MKQFILFFFLILSLNGFSQSIKKKFFGIYEGKIPTYKMDIGGDIVTVQSSNIRINIQEDFIEQEIGNVSRKGKWKLYFEGKTYFILKMKLEGQVVEERVILYKKSSKITREGLFPQPSAELNKIM